MQSHPAIGRFAATLLGLAGATACAPGVTPEQAVRNDGVPPGFSAASDFQPVPPEVGVTRSALGVEGEVIVVDGDARTVSSDGMGGFGISADNQRNLVNDVVGLVGDRFDSLVIFTAFDDQAPASGPYYVQLANRVSGIGLGLGEVGRTTLGLPAGGRLTGYVGMGSPAAFANGNLDGLNATGGSYHAAIAAQLARRWAMYLSFRESGQSSGALLDSARSGAWSALAQSNGSPLSGTSLERTDDPADAMGFLDYRVVRSVTGFSGFDRYAMGLIPVSQVPATFYLSEATVNGVAVDADANLADGSIVKGKPVVVSAGQVVQDLGARVPSAEQATPYYRVAFVFVTTPGTDRSRWEDQLTLVGQVQQALPTSWKEWRGGNLCTQISEPCPEPNLAVEEPVIEDDGDGLVAPGETVRVRPVIGSFGLGTAEGVTVSASSSTTSVTVAGGPFTAPSIPQGQSVTLSDAFEVTVGTSTRACGTSVPLTITLQTREGPVFTGDAQIPIGTASLRFDPIEEPTGWRVDPEGTDSASAGMWAFGDPEMASGPGVVTQPENDHTPGEDRFAFFTGPSLEGFFGSNDLDDGKTTLESPVFAVASALDPSLVVWVWRTSYDTLTDPPTALSSSPLVISVSNDGGASYTELHRVTSQTQDWLRLSLRLKDVIEVTDRMRFRFEISETTNANTEAGIDDLEIVDFLPVCAGADPEPDPDPTPDPTPVDPTPDDEDEGGCRCVAPALGARSLWMLGLAAGLLRLGRRRRGRA